jgi:hypothetical protein
MSDDPNAYLETLLRVVAERFAALPLEAEPSSFLAEQRRNAP